MTFRGYNYNGIYFEIGSGDTVLLYNNSSSCTSYSKRDVKRIIANQGSWKGIPYRFFYQCLNEAEENFAQAKKESDDLCKRLNALIKARPVNL